MILLIGAIVLLTQSGPATPNIGRQGPLLVAEEVFTGTVVSVEDGDTAVVKAPSEQMTVHLAGLDAPETSQPGGQQAKEFLTALIAGKTVTVRLTNVSERFAKIEIGGKDVTATLIRAGMGWHCPRYSDDRELTEAEAEARAAKRGLWRVPQPTPPWLYRGAGACWQQTAKPRVSSQYRPDFSGEWTAVSPAHRAGQRLRIKQDAISLTLSAEERRWNRPARRQRA